MAAQEAQLSSGGLGRTACPDETARGASACWPRQKNCHATRATRGNLPSDSAGLSRRNRSRYRNRACIEPVSATTAPVAEVVTSETPCERPSLRFQSFPC